MLDLRIFIGNDIIYSFCSEVFSQRIFSSKKRKNKFDRIGILISIEKKCKFDNKVLKMTYTDKHIVETYSKLFEGLSSISKIELIKKLANSIKKEKKTIDNNFYKSFGAFGSEKPAEKIAAEIKSSRKFKNKEFKF